MGSDGTMLNPIFWKKVEGQNILGGERLQSAKYLVSKLCLKQNTNGQKHPSISLFIIEQDIIGETKETNNWHWIQFAFRTGFRLLMVLLIAKNYL